MTGYSSSSKAEIRDYITACVRPGKDSKEIFKELCDVYWNNFMSLRQVYRWFSKFKSCQTDFKDKQRPGATRVALTDAILAKMTNITTNMLV